MSSARNAALNAALKDADQLMTAVHVEQDVQLFVRLYHGHMALVQALMRAQDQLHESGYQPDVRSTLVGPAHRAVMLSARALARAAVQHTPEEVP